MQPLGWPQDGSVAPQNQSEAEQHLQETSNNFTGAGDHVPKFLNELNIGWVYIAGDTLIYCTGDRLCIQ